MSGKYIVVFKDGVTSDQITKYVNEVKNNGGEVTNRYDVDGSINGFAASIPSMYLTSLQSLHGDLIAYIEPDGVVTIQ